MNEKWDAMSNEELCVEYQQTNNDDLFEYFYNKNKNLAFYFARSYLRNNINDRDMIEQRSRIAFWKAMRYYDITKETKFTTIIKYFMLRELMRNTYENNIVRLPWSIVSNYTEYFEEHPEKEIRVDSLDSILTTGNTLDDIVTKEPEDHLDENEKLLLRKDLRKMLKILPPRQEQIIIKYFGFDDGAPKTLQHVANEYNVSRERIRQIVVRGLERLRKAYKKDLMD